MHPQQKALLSKVSLLFDQVKGQNLRDFILDKESSFNQLEEK
jgi:hypothetical protein